MSFQDDNNLDLSTRTLIAMGSSATGSDLIINDAGASYTEQTLSAKAIKVSCASTNDTSNGTGAQTVRLSGVDGDYNEISEVLTLNGQTQVTSTKTYLFITQLEVLTVGTGGANAGIIYAGTGTASSGVPQVQILNVVAGNNVSKAGILVVPAGYNCVMLDSAMNNGTATNICQLKLWTKTASSPYVLRRKFLVAGLSTAFSPVKYSIPEKTFVKVTGNNASSTSAMMFELNYRLVPNFAGGKV